MGIFLVDEQLQTLAVGQVVKALDCGANTVRRLLERGELRGYTHATGYRRIFVESVRDYMLRRGIPLERLKLAGIEE